MYQSKKSIQKKSLPALKKDFQVFLANHPKNKIYSTGLKRPLFLDEFPDAIIKRKDAKHRLEALSVAIDIAKHSKEIIPWGNDGYAIIGSSKEGVKVGVHIREKWGKKKDKKLYIVSFFHK